MNLHIIRIEVENFKSYRGKHLIGPFTWFSSVIGPNGSGKSNVMDAVCFGLGLPLEWVRVSNVSDLVYTLPNGPPEFPMKVELFLGDLQSNQLEPLHVLRREILGTSGLDSKFYLDGERLDPKSYTARLSELGIAISQPNFLVFQGDVHALAEKSPLELTALIERASRSVELKPEYERLLKKKNKADSRSVANMREERKLRQERLRLKKQKEEADTFTKLNEKRAEALTQQTLMHINWLSKAYSEQLDILETKRTRLRDLQSRQKIITNELRMRSKMRTAVSEQRSELESTVRELELALSAKKPNKAALIEEVKTLDRRSATLSSNILRVSKNLSKYEESESELGRQLDYLTDQLDALAPSPTEEISFDREEFAKILYSQEFQEALESIGLEKLEKEMSSRRNSVESAKRAKIKRKAELERMESSFERAKKTHEQLSGNIKTTESELLSLASARRGAETDREKMRRAVLELERRDGEISARLRELKSGARERKKEKRHLENVKQLARLFPGIHGTISSLCTASDVRHSLALSALFGAQGRSIVVDDEKTAFECIRYMKDRRMGRATFLPLGSLKVRRRPQDEQLLPPGTILAVDALNFPKTVQKAVEYVCGDALIAESLDIARDIAFRGIGLGTQGESGEQKRRRVVTIAGHLITKRGAMTRISTENLSSSSIAWETKESEALKAESVRLRDEIRRIRAREALSDVGGAVTEYHNLEKRAEFTREELNTKEIEVARFSEQVDKSKKKLEEAREKLKKSQERATEAEERFSEAMKTAEEVAGAAFKEFCRFQEIRDVGAFVGRFVLKRSEEAIQRTRLLTLKSQISRELESKVSDVKESRKQISEMESEISGLLKQKREAQSKLEEVENEMSAIEVSLKNARRDLESRRTEAKDKMLELGELAKESSRIGDEIEAEVKLLTNEEAKGVKLQEQRRSVLKRAKLREIEVPVEAGSLPLSRLFLNSGSFRAGEGYEEGGVYERMGIVDEDDDAEREFTLTQNVIEISTSRNEDTGEDNFAPDYSFLKPKYRLIDTRESFEELDGQLEEKISLLNGRIEQIAPNLRAGFRMGDVDQVLQGASEEWEEVRKKAADLRKAFSKVKRRRKERFMRAYSHVSRQVNRIYGELTSSSTGTGTGSSIGGTAYLTLENSEEPYLYGTRYTVMPPLKRFREMDQLSGGEKTVAALAMLLALHSFYPAPFYIMDEIDSALDSENVERVARYLTRGAGPGPFIEESIEERIEERDEEEDEPEMIREGRNKNKNPGLQVVVISLKEQFFSHAETLFGVTTNRQRGSSEVFSLDLRRFTEN